MIAVDASGQGAEICFAIQIEFFPLPFALERNGIRDSQNPAVNRVKRCPIAAPVRMVEQAAKSAVMAVGLAAPFALPSALESVPGAGGGRGLLPAAFEISAAVEECGEKMRNFANESHVVNLAASWKQVK